LFLYIQNQNTEIHCSNFFSSTKTMYIVFWKKSVLELQFECEAGIVLVVQQNFFRGLVNEFHVVFIVSQVPEFVCKQLRKTANTELSGVYW